jgi:hypothetical protein
MQQETRKTDMTDAERASAPTEPDAFLLWSSQRRREEGKFELTRGRVVCNMIPLGGLGVELAMAAIFRGMPDALGP